MNILSFAIGALSMVGLIVVSLTVLGVVKAYRAIKEISNVKFAMHQFQDQLTNDISEIHRRIDLVEQDTDRRIIDVERNLYDAIQNESRSVKSYVDSRIDKLEKPSQSKPTEKVLIKD